MKILVLNSGSSSLKYQMINMETGLAMAEGICERIGMEGSVMKYKADGTKEKILHDMPTHKEGIDLLLKTLVDKKVGVVDSINEIDTIGHRVAHGGEKFDSSVLVDAQVLEAIKELSNLAPLHNPANVLGIELCMELMPDKPNVAVFDTAFHQTMPEKSFMYALPYEDYEELKIRKYGFHGTSHKYVSKLAGDLLDKEDAKIIVCHLGNGASVSAVRGGNCLDTSMGLTPLQGLMMGTRCGDLDPAAVLHIMEERKLTIKEMDERINKKSGFLGVFGESSDCRDVEDGVEAGNRRAKLAYDMFCHRVKHYIGAYAAIMGGLDAVCFTAGIGENGPEIRELVCEGLEFVGIDFDKKENNERKDGVQVLSKPDSKVKVYKIPTNEEYVIAEDAYKLFK